MQKISLILLTFSLCLNRANGQNSNQFWSDILLNTPLKNNYRLDNQLTYRTDLNTTSKWSTYQVQSQIVRPFGKRWEVLLNFLFNYTHQVTKLNTMELRPGAGVGFTFIRTARVRFGSLLRYESRSIYTVDTAIWSNSDRLRFRLETTVLLKGEKVTRQHSWYMLTDAELFYTIDKEVRERYASRVRFRGGVGYALTGSLRLEAIFAYQVSGNTILKSEDNTQQNIFWLRAIFLTK